MEHTDSRGKIEIIQVLRGIAAIGIVYFHTEYGLWKSANWGVDFFFILSGYFSMVSTEKYISGKAPGYWKNKLIRLYPLYFTMTSIVAIACLLAPGVFRTAIVNAETLFKSFLFIPCYARNGKIFPVYSLGWTLNLEMFFYVLVFLSLKFSHRYRGWILAGVLMILISLGLVFDPEGAVSRFWSDLHLSDFLIGVAVYHVEKQHFSVKELFMPESLEKIGCAVVAVALACLFSGTYLLGSHFHFLWNSLWGGVLLIVAVFCLKAKRCNQFLILLGDMSYSIYLTHFMVIGIACRMLIENTDINVINTGIVIMAIVTAIGCSEAVHWLFEVQIVNMVTAKTGGN